MKPKKKRKESRKQYCSPLVEKHNIASLATRWNMDAVGAIEPCGTCTPE
jgi:hypothetical protein